MADTPPIVTWGTFAIAVLAFIQPYAYALWRRRFRARDITVYHSLLPDIGYSLIGLAVGLSGTIATRNMPSMITSIRLRAQRENYGSEHVLDAYLNRKRSISNEGGGKDNIAGEIWVPFKADADGAYPYDILFVETAKKGSLDKLGTALRSAWQSFAVPKITRELSSGALTTDQRAARIRAIFEEFKNEPVFAETGQRIRDDVAWQEGSYRLTMEVRCAESKRAFYQQWTFALSRSDAGAIDGNVEIIEAYMCEFPPAVAGNLVNVYPPLERGPASPPSALST